MSVLRRNQTIKGIAQRQGRLFPQSFLVSLRPLVSQPGFTSVAAKGVAVNWGGGRSGVSLGFLTHCPQVCVGPQTLRPPPSILSGGPSDPASLRPAKDVEVPIRPSSPH